MNKQSIIQFHKGINQDLSNLHKDQGNLFSSRNYRLSTDNLGGSTAVLTTEKGNTLSFILPDLSVATYGNDTIPAQNNLTIIGYCEFEDSIILFTCNNEEITPVDKIGQIWKVNIDYSNRSIVGLSPTNYLVPSIHLLYNNKINFSRQYRVKAIGRYETDKIQRVYFTDNYNQVRAANIADPDLINQSPSSLDLRSDFFPSQPTFISVGTGNLPVGTMAQFTYQLFDTSGSSTVYGPLSELIPLTKSNPYTSDYKDFEGDGDPSVDKQASVTYSLKGLDQNYSYISHIIIVYTKPNVYTAYKFQEETIPTEELIVVCSDIDTAITIDPVELNMVSSAFDIAKDIEVSQNRLIATNTKSNLFDVEEYDTRVYRFDSSQESLIFNSNENLSYSIDGTNPDYDIIPETFDSINHYNHEDRSDWFSKQYKYQADGVTYGGSGKNISYKFTVKEFPSNFLGSGVTTTVPHISVNRWNPNQSTETLGIVERDSSNKAINKENQFKNNTSIYGPAYYKGYSRGEVYRFGIVFFSKKNQPSFTKWIGDIKFPEPEDGFPVQNIIGGIPYNYSLGIEFTIDISSIKDQISGYQIVRLERQLKDKTRLGTGVLMGMGNTFGGGSVVDYWENTNDGGLSWGSTTRATINGILPLLSEYCQADKPGFLELAPTKVSARVQTLISPLGQIYPYQFRQNDYIKTTGYYEAIPTKYYNSGNPDNSESWGFYYKLERYHPINHPRELFEVAYGQIMRVGEYIPTSVSSIPSYTNGIRNSSIAKVPAIPLNPNVPLGLGSQKTLLILDSTPSVTHSTGDPATTMGWYDSGIYNNNWTNTDIAPLVYFKEVSYCRYLQDQYGGDTYEDRSRNQYISTNNYYPVDNGSGSIQTFKVFGGDTFVNYFDDEIIQPFLNRESAYKDPYNDPINNKLSVAICVPVESPVNTDYIIGERWASNRDAASFTTYENNSNKYNFVFSQDNTTENKFFAQDFLINLSSIHRHRIWASDAKTDGELIDNWRRFKVGNSIEVNGGNGPVNRLITFGNKLFFYQDKAFGVVAVDNKIVSADEFGIEFTLGRGQVIDYGYISQSTGSSHQFGVVASSQALYHIDSRNKRIYQYNQGLIPLSDSQGLFSYLNNNLDGDILTKDKTVLLDPVGFEFTWDQQYNRLLFTALNNKKVKDRLILNEINQFDKDSVILFDGEYYIAEEPFSLFLTEVMGESDIKNILENKAVKEDNYQKGFTLSYNENLGCFESTYDYKPSIYLNTGRELFSLNRFNQKEVYLHNNNNYFGKYYGFVYPFEIGGVMVGEVPLISKTFNNIEYNDHIQEGLTQLDIFDKSFNQYKVKNEYQNTYFQDLIEGENYQKRLRTNRFSITRDQVRPLDESRIRSYWSILKLKWEKDSHNGLYRQVVYPIIYKYNISAY